MTEATREQQVIAVERPELADRIHRGIADVRWVAPEEGIYAKLSEAEPPGRRDEIQPWRAYLGAVSIATPVCGDVVPNGRWEHYRRHSNELSHLFQGVALQLVPKASRKGHVDFPGAGVCEEFDRRRTCSLKRVDDDGGVAAHM